MATLVFWCKSENHFVQANALKIMTYLAAEDHAQSTLVESSLRFAFGRRIVEEFRGLGVIMALVGSAHKSIRRLSCELLAAMSAFDPASRLIVMSPTVKKLVCLLVDPGVEICAAAAKVLACLSRNVENRGDLASLNGLTSVTSLIETISSPPVQVATWCRVMTSRWHFVLTYPCCLVIL